MRSKLLGAARFLAASGLLLALVGASYGQATAPLTSKVKDQVLASIRKILEDKAFVPNVDFSKWESYVSKDKSEIAKAKTDDQFAAAVQSAVSKFGVSHIYLMTPNESRSRIDHSIVGIGISFFQEPDGILITRIFKGSAAYAAHLSPGDLIESVNGDKTDILEHLRGKKNSKVNVEVKHDDGKVQKYVLTREPFDITIPATLQEVNKTTDILTVPTFDITYDAQKIQDLLDQAHDVPNLIVDLRSNPGGALLNMLQFLSLTLKPDTAIGEIITPREIKAYQKDHPGKVDVVKVAQGIPAAGRLIVAGIPGHPNYQGHIAVLINQGSGSAAEIAAEALKETRNAVIIGQKSAGAVLVSEIYQIADGFMLECPKYDYVSVDGRRLEGKGVKPDILATTPIVPSLTKDPGIKAALQALAKRDQNANDGKSVRV